MSDQRDPEIKLFGRVIPLAAGAEEPAPGALPSEQQTPVPEEQMAAAVDEDQHNKKGEKEDSETKLDASQDKKDNEMKVDPPFEEKYTETKVDTKQEKEDAKMIVDSSQMTGNVDPNRSDTSDPKKDDQAQMGNAKGKATSDPERQNQKTANDESGQDKTLKKPDKIIPCPRCNSMDTKFCYYNNYNVNQPRHFCKNCQRYWTAGGTMRNVPVGAGRRKSKNSSLHNRQLLMAPDCIMGSRVDISTSLHPEALPCSPSTPIQPTSRNESVLKFGPEVPLCESMVSGLNIDEQNVTKAGPAPRVESREDNSCASSVTSYNGLPENAVNLDKNGAPVYCNGAAPMPPYYLGAPFMYPWGVGWNDLPVMMPGASMTGSALSSEGCSASSVPWMNCPMMPASRPGPAFPYPIMPPALWGCLSGWPATPWIRANGCLSPSSSSNSSCSGNGSPTLGKHSRDSDPLKEEKEKSLWIPKTLRIDDPDEAAKSSIWATLGIKPGKPGTFKPFQSKLRNDQTSDSAPVLQANPAALSRSQSFQETS